MFKFLDQKPWWLKVIFYFVTYPVTVPLIVWNKTKNSKNKNIIRTLFVIAMIPIYFVIAIIYVAILMPSQSKSGKEVTNINSNIQNSINSTSISSVTASKPGEDQKQKDKEKQDQQAKIEKDIENEKVQEKKNLEATRIANRTPKEKIADLSNELFKSSKGYISSGEYTATLDVDMDSKSAYDEKHYLEMMLVDFVKFGTEAAKIDGLQDVEVKYNGGVTDKYGKKSTSTIFSILMSKEKFIKYDFKNLEGSNGRMYSAIVDDAGIFILPSTRTKINFSEVKFYYPK